MDQGGLEEYRNQYQYKGGGGDLVELSSYLV